MVINRAGKMEQKRAEWEAGSLKVGFVPTMGAFHDGHLALVDQSARENDITVVSIFVNPTQFNDKNDYTRYPREPQKDLDKLSRRLNEADVVFMPAEKDIYPVPDHRRFLLDGLDQLMEGVSRPGHFNGVVQVVTRLFDLIRPHRAYFGEKDFQQLTIVRHISSKLGYMVEIISCPIVREPDGLAMSSRNVLLTPMERKLAPEIYKTLVMAREKSGTMTVQDVKDEVTRRFEKFPAFHLDYFEIVDDATLHPVLDWKIPGGKVGCIAVKLGTVRLIDNIRFNS